MDLFCFLFQIIGLSLKDKFQISLQQVSTLGQPRVFVSNEMVSFQTVLGTVGMATNMTDISNILII